MRQANGMTASKRWKSSSSRRSKQRGGRNDHSLEKAERYFVDNGSTTGQDVHQESVERFRHLLSQNEFFHHFIGSRGKIAANVGDILQEAVSLNEAAKEKPRDKRRTLRRGHKNEEHDSNEEPPSILTENPEFINGQLRDYQIDGVNWLISLFENHLSGILADEMGLGKTLQTITFLGYLRYLRGTSGPHLIIVPKSTVDNWAREFAKWTPEVSVVVLSGDKDQRADTIQNRLLKCDFDVCITFFEMVIREKNVLKKFAWFYIVVDEAHRIKNEESLLSRIVRMFFSRYRLLITGTPLQNNLHELWALLNFLLPDVFRNSDTFDQWFQADDSRDQDKVVEQLHKLLHPFLLRRVKSDVEGNLLPKHEINLYVGMTDMQVQWYHKLLEKDIDTITDNSDKHKGKLGLLNVAMQLRKCCNHPYLFDGAEPGPPFTTDEHIVQNSGKMILLDKLLKLFKKNGSRVLIFSQMSRMLDILEDFCNLRNYEFCRIDGSTAHEERIEAIDDFNRPGSEKFVFLLTTRAGGLGINLTTADQVVLYDSDWNPQADLQAMDRAHRIGQTKQVCVYRFVTENGIEEKVLERAAQKLQLDQLVIQQGRQAPQGKNSNASKQELMSMICHGAPMMLERQTGTFVDDTIENYIKQGEIRTQTLKSKFSGLGLDELQKLTFEHPTITLKRPQSQEPLEHSHSRRERKEISYGAVELTERATRTPRFPRQISLQDYQFFPPELKVLQDRELAWYRKQVGFLKSAEPFFDELEESFQEISESVKNAEPLTALDVKRKEELISMGFPDMTRRDFHHYLNLVGRYGKDNIDDICANWPEKDSNEIRRYHKVFFERFTELQDHEKIKHQLEAGELKVQKQNHQYELLKRKVLSCEAPLSQLEINYPGGSTKRSYSLEEDRFLLVQMCDIGLSSANLYEKIRDRIRASDMFAFNWFFMSRTPVELSRRCATLLLIITREVDGPNALKRKHRARNEDLQASDEDSPRSRKKVHAELAS